MFDIPSIKEDSKNSEIFLNFFDSLEENEALDYNDEEINNVFKKNNLKKKRKRQEDIINKKEKLKKKAESAKKARLRKKLLFESLIEENKKLRNLINIYQKEIQFKLCKECKKKLNKPEFIFKIEQNNNNNKKIISKKPLFSIIITIILILVLFSFNNINIANEKKSIRNLEQKDYFEISNKELQNINLTHNKLYISFGDYYSLISKNNFLNGKNLIFSMKKEGIKYIKEEDFDFNKIKDCKHCIIELYRNNIEFAPDRINRFKVFFYPKNIITPEGLINYSNNIDEKGNKYETFFEIDCLAIGFSENRLYENNNIKNL
jgi:hypothetical protein